MAVDYSTLKKGGFMRQKQKNCFSLRLRTVGGHLSAEQLAKIAEVSDKYGEGYIHLTSRQGVEIPFIRLEQIDEVKNALEEGSVTPGVCGPRVRTITACQGSAVCPSGCIDTYALAQEIDERYFGRELPHKFKFGITGCQNNCLKAEENDVGIKGGIQVRWKEDACIQCGVCVKACRTKAIELNDGKITMDATKKNLSHKQIMRSPAVCLSVLTVGVLAVSIAELCLGPQSYSLEQLWNAFAQQSTTDPVWRVLAYVRIPRLLAGLLAGAALAVAGTLLQAVLNNAMASPNVIGVNSGAGFFALLAAALAPEALGAAQFASFLGALGCAMLVYGLARLTGLSRTTLVLSGLAVSGMFSAGINIIRLLWPESVSSAPSFLVGGLSGATLKMLLLALPYLFTGAILAFWIDTDLNVLCLGDETASSLGLNVETIRFIGILAAALLAGAAVSFAGLLSFVGLLAPHIARKIIGNDHRVLLPASALLGAFCVVGCDLPARLLFAPFELPVGILLSLIGGPFFLGLLLRHKGGRLYA